MVVRCEEKRQGFTACATCGTALLFGLRESAKTEAHLNRVDARVRSGHTGVGDMHEADFGVPVIFALQKVRSDRTARREIHARCSRRCLLGGEERAAAKIDVRRNTVVLDKVPLQRERIQTESVRRAGFLRQPKDGNNIDCEFEAATQWTRRDRIRQDPAVAQTQVPHTRVSGAAVDAVASAGPYLEVMTPVLWSGLRNRCRGKQNGSKRDGCENALHP